MKTETKLECLKERYSDTQKQRHKVGVGGRGESDKDRRLNCSYTALSRKMSGDTLDKSEIHPFPFLHKVL